MNETAEEATRVPELIRGTRWSSVGARGRRRWLSAPQWHAVELGEAGAGQCRWERPAQGTQGK